MTELKPCPFCGSDGLKLYRKFGVYCMTCFRCGVDVDLTYGEAESKMMWNKRVDG